MKCVFVKIGPSSKREGWFKYRCRRKGCWLVGHSPHADVWVDGIERVKGPMCQGDSEELVDGQSETEGPGTELHKIFDSLGVKPTAACECERMQAWMNWLGAEGCQAKRAELLAHLRKGYDEAAVTTKARAWILAKVKFLPTTIEGLLDLAIERATSTTRIPA